MSSPQTTVTRLLHALQRGDQAAFDQLFPLVYDKLHDLAHHQRRDWYGDYTLNTTALVHEAYLKLVDQTQVEPTSRAHFMGMAAKAMRHILIDYARRRNAKKRGGDRHKVSFEAVKQALGPEIAMSQERTETLLALDEALDLLAERHERQSRVVECRFFGGMTIAETASALGVSPVTVKRDWAMAQAWLYRHMQPA